MFPSHWVNVPSTACPALLALLTAIRSLLWSRAQLQAEVLALRHPAARPQARVRRKAAPLSDLRADALVLAFAALAGMASRTPGNCGPLAPTRLPPVLALEKPLAVAWTTPIEGEIRELILEMHRAIPPGVLLGSMANCSSLVTEPGPSMRDRTSQ